MPVQIDSEALSALAEWARVRQTTVVMAVLTAFVALLFRWCDSTDTIVPYVTNGRRDPKLENTVGYLASLLYIRIRLERGDTFQRLLEHITAEYCNALQHADFFYLEAVTPRPEFSRNAYFNWVPTAPDTESRVTAGEDEIELSRVHFEHPLMKTLERNAEPYIMLFETTDGIVGGVHYPAYRFQHGTMESFVDNFLMFIAEMVKHSQTKVETISML